MFGNTAAQPPVEKKPANIDADQISTNQQAVPVPYLLGWTRRSLHYIAPVYNQKTTKVTTKTGKDQTSTIGFIYYGDVAGIFCVVGRRVPLTEIRRIIIDSSIAWESTGGLVIADPYSPITVADYGTIRIYRGQSNQPIDSLVLTPISNTVPPGVDPRDTKTWPNGDETKNPP